MFTRKPIAYKPGDSEKWQRLFEEYHRTKNSPRKNGDCGHKEQNNG